MKLKVKSKNIILIIILLVLILLTKVSIDHKRASVELNLSEAPSAVDVAVKETIKVYITGEINKPGLYDLIENDRLDTLVTKAGGFTAEADETRINLARVLTDGEKIYIPSKTNENDSPEHYTLTDLNSIDKEQLMAFDGIGEVLAQRIIDKRHSKPFTSLKELKTIEGIGEKKYQEIIKNFY
jgi:competence protein ComEA